MTENTGPKLRSALSTAQLTMIAIGGAIGTGLFLGSGFAIQLAGPGVLLSFLLGSVIALLLMGSLAEMCAAEPLPGAFGAYAEKYVGPLAGFLVRYSYWSAVVLAVGAEVSAIAVYMRYWWPAVPGFVWILLFAGALVAVNAMRVEAFGAVEYSLSIVKVLAIVSFLALGSWLIFRAAHGSAMANLRGHGGFLPHGSASVWQGTVVALFSYFSVEMIAVAAAEAKDPKRAVIRAFRGTMLRLVIFYLGTLAVTLMLIPWTEVANSAQSPLVRVMQSTSIPYAAAILNAVLLVAALSAINSQLYIASRMLFSLAETGYAPRALAKLSAQGVPVRALAVSSAGIAVAFVVQAFAPGKAFASMMAVATFGAMFTWLMIFVTHLMFRRGRNVKALPFKLALYPVTPLLGALLMLRLFVTTAFVPGFELTLLYGVPFLAVMTAVYLVFFRVRPVARRIKDAR